jgi:hypothetical protein
MPVVAASTSGSELPVTVSDLIAATRDHLQGTYRSEWNTLAADMAASDTTLTVGGALGGIVRTSYICIDDEILYVLNTNPTTGIVNVIRGFDGTAAAAHTSGALVEVTPRFPRHMIRRQLALEIASWPDNLFQVAQATVTLNANGATFAYDLGVPSGQVLYLLDVRHAPWDGTFRNTWPTFAYPPKLNRNVDPAVFPSGVVLEVPAVDPNGCATVIGNVACRVTYATGFNLASMDDTVLLGAGGLGLAASMLDIPPLGAASRLMGPREALRTFGEAMDQTRNSQDVPPGAAMKVAMYLKASRDQRIAEEMEHLNVTWPSRVK